MLRLSTVTVRRLPALFDFWEDELNCAIPHFEVGTELFEAASTIPEHGASLGRRDIDLEIVVPLGGHDLDAQACRAMDHADLEPFVADELHPLEAVGAFL